MVSIKHPSIGFWNFLVVYGVAAIFLAACGGNGSDTAYTVTASAGSGGTISPFSVEVRQGESAKFTITPDGEFGVTEISGCSGSLVGLVYITGPISTACNVHVTFDRLTQAPELSLSFRQPKKFSFSWTDVLGETEYRLLENVDGHSGYIQVATIQANSNSHDLTVFLPERTSAAYVLQACNLAGCLSSSPVFVSGNLAEAIGLLKATPPSDGEGFGQNVAISADGKTIVSSARSTILTVEGQEVTAGSVYVYVENRGQWSLQKKLTQKKADLSDRFGESIAISADGNLVVIGAPGESSRAIGINGDENDNSMEAAGAVYAFARSQGEWTQQAYIKASNTDRGDWFGASVAVSSDGNTLAVGALGESSNATGINGNQLNNDGFFSGAVYVFNRNGGSWNQSAYIKASNSDISDFFGTSLALSHDGDTLVVGAPRESSSSRGVGGNQENNLAVASGAVYVFGRQGDTWSQKSYIKASNADNNDQFGRYLSLSGDGSVLVVGSSQEGSAATGVNGNQMDNSAGYAGAAYVFSRVNEAWDQQAYLKASNAKTGQSFSSSVSLSSDGNTLAVSSPLERSNASGIDGDQQNELAPYAGSVYIFKYAGGAWSQRNYIKASNTSETSLFGNSVMLSGDARVLVVGAPWEDNDSPKNSGAIYLY